ncbi:uncharacterized protein LOC131147761, partial [Malania oleifera]|uniref:uncharacterized protein LOC131147761 n=1 Tax=Malania oleifera TaxID=397392 RepID=UPI0025AE3FED
SKGFRRSFDFEGISTRKHIWRSGAYLRCCLVFFAVVSTLCVSGPALYWWFRKGIRLGDGAASSCPPPLSILKIVPVYFQFGVTSETKEIKSAGFLQSGSSTIFPDPRFESNYFLTMSSEESKDPLKGLDWKNIGESMRNEPSVRPVIKKRLPKKIRQVPECYFLPRRSLPSAIALYGSIIAAGVGAGMLGEIWINKKVKEDGGVIWEFDK